MLRQNTLALFPVSRRWLRIWVSSIEAVRFLFMIALVQVAHADVDASPAMAPIPAEVSSSHFTVTVNGIASPVMHAASGYYLLNFDVSGPSKIVVTADDPHYWDAGVEVQPMRFGIRPRRQAGSIAFSLPGPAKLSISRPGDHFADSEMLFLFANQPDLSGITAQTPGVRYYGPGIHRENIDAHTGDHIYLAPGAVVFGALNLWQVHDVHVSGGGTIIYDGPQDPAHDEGWMHKQNWHVIVMDNAHDIEIAGITGIVRSRTWMVQMRDSRGIVFRNVKIIGGSPGNANQDGMDWLGGGDTLVQDSFIRAADDIFAMYGNWDGYEQQALTAPGHEVSNIIVENSVLSTSISNVVRLGWPGKVFNSHGFTLRNSDVIHMGVGGCGVPFALFEIWADPAGEGLHTGIQFENIRLDDWYSLVQLRQLDSGIRDVSFRYIWAMDGLGMVPSVLKGSVEAVSFEGVDLGSGYVLNKNSLPLQLLAGASEPHFAAGDLNAGFAYSPGLIHPGSSVRFHADGPQKLHYRWLFGDDTSAEGRTVRHAFTDTQGTLLDGGGRFRVLLAVSDDAGHQAWSSQSVVVAGTKTPAMPKLKSKSLASGLKAAGGPSNSEEGFVNIPADGGYTFTLLTSTSASLMIDSVRAVSTKPRPQVCGSPGNAVQRVRVTAALARGLHSIRMIRGAEVENATPPEGASDRALVFWEGPRLRRQLIPEASLFHIR